MALNSRSLDRGWERVVRHRRYQLKTSHIMHKKNYAALSVMEIVTPHGGHGKEKPYLSMNMLTASR